LNSDDFDQEEDAVSAVGATSSPQGPPVPELYVREDVPFLDLGSDDFGPDDLDDTYGSNSRAPKTSNTEKTVAVLAYMKATFPKFSLRELLTELFTSEDGSIKKFTNTYLGTGGCMDILQTIVPEGHNSEDVDNWIMAKATEICGREVSWLTDNARKGPFHEKAKSLRIPANSMKVQLLKTFSIPGLLELYEHTTTHLQKFLKDVIGKEPLAPEAGDSGVRVRRNPDLVSTRLIHIMWTHNSQGSNNDYIHDS
jgi:hypothetical protein